MLPRKKSMISVKQNQMYRYLVLLTISSTLGLEAWLTLFNNFAVEAVGLEGNHIGVIQSIREIPGFLTFLVVFILLHVKEHRLAALSIVMLGLGMAATGLLPSYFGLIFTTLIMSFGFHYFDATCDSLTLQYFDTKTSPLVFGKLSSLASVTNIGVGILIYCTASLLNFTQIYLLIGCLVSAAGLWGLFQNPTDSDIIPQHRKIVLRKKYWLFYFLTFMAGARRQIFMAFAVFLMVKKFQFSVHEVTALFVINNVINYFLFPIIGKGIIKFGERKILSAEYFSLIFIFAAYATAQSKWLIMILYILDQVFYNFHIAIQTYFQKIGDPKDIASSISVSFTINHIAAVVLPALGGVLWMIDYRIPFISGAVFSFVSLMAVQRIQTER
ncbi:MFS transporter [Desulfococcaceae bacterium HSG7]|nr:MFS transporter [Desulfococcaceae bacterium HSG7]